MTKEPIKQIFKDKQTLDITLWKSYLLGYIHEDDKYIELLKSIKNNNNNSINFSDSSLVKPILNEHGHINKKPSSNPKSEDVRECIKHLLRNSNKLLVLIGKDTHSNGWAK